MPAHDVSDLRDVVDAIDRLCGAMRDSDSTDDVSRDAKSSDDVSRDAKSSDDVSRDAKSSDDITRDAIQVCDVERSDDVTELVNPDEIVVCEVETYVAELWSVASSSWEESVETTASNPSPIPAEEVAGVDVDSSVMRVESVVNVKSNPIKNLDVVPSHRIVEPVPSTGVVDTVPRNRSTSRINKDSVVLDATVPSVENIVSVTANVTRVENEPVVSESFKLDIVNTVSNTSPVRPDINTVAVGLLKPDYSDIVDPSQVAPHVTSHRPSTQENVESDQSTRAEDMRTASEMELTCEPLSEMYYTASSEASLLSLDVPDRIGQECAEGRLARDDNNGVMAGHVAAMRERFENMTRTNTPCPDYMRSISPSLDVYRTVTPSPDRLS